jgi:hypothetical protein
LVVRGLKAVRVNARLRHVVSVRVDHAVDALLIHAVHAVVQRVDHAVDALMVHAVRGPSTALTSAMNARVIPAMIASATMNPDAPFRPAAARSRAPVTRLWLRS